MKPAIIVHGGAWDIPDEEVKAHREGCRKAVAAGWEVLDEGGSALDAVQAAVTVMENDPTFDAGYGATLNAAGEVELDAMLMDGATLRAGAVAAVRFVRNPIVLARAVMEQGSHAMLVGEGAWQFAARQGIALCAPEELVVERELQRYRSLRRQRHQPTRSFFERQPRGTVGAVAIDWHGHVAAATSTGGTPLKAPGRVGDSALIGCGTYADDATGAVSASGWGETIMRVVLAKTICDLMGAGFDSREAVREGIAILGRKVQGLGGAIAINSRGQVGWGFNTPRMAYAYMIHGGEIVTGI
ncbi:MAG: isoaspartyl peptidase/L-asparaginase [candidate division KSB1 bacterium]|nr:isoaspartyl peptidase/L-asparaginase [candidate division KSB1 bacterium]MDZ7412075.1 isoaspartyl peptidase/L-asparaginase [candidate division KSB1 bacterium]